MLERGAGHGGRGGRDAGGGGSCGGRDGSGELHERAHAGVAADVLLGRTADVKVTDAGPNAWRISDANGTGWEQLDGCTRLSAMTVTCGGNGAKPAGLLLFFLSDGN